MNSTMPVIDTPMRRLRVITSLVSAHVEGIKVTALA